MKYFFWIPQALLVIAVYVGLMTQSAPDTKVVRGWETISILIMGMAEIGLFAYYTFAVREKTAPKLILFSVMGAVTTGVFVSMIHVFYIPLSSNVAVETFKWLAGTSVLSIPVWVCAIGFAHHIFDVKFLDM